MESIWSLLAYVVIGGLAGILAGLFGIGGGVIAVPCLLLVFNYLSVSPGYEMHLAIGTSLAAMVFNTISSTWAHNQKGAVLWDVVKKTFPGVILGSVVGALIANYLSSIVLQIFFGVFLIVLAAFLLRLKKFHDGMGSLPSLLGLNVMTFGIAGVSNILGIGGGVFTAPILMLFKVSDKKSIGTSAAMSVGITVLGALSYLVVGLEELPVGQTIGFIYWPAFVVVGIASFLTAPLGAKWAYELHPQRLRKVFALVLALTGIFMVFG